MTIALQRAPDDFHEDLGQREPGVGGASLLFAVPHDYVIAEDDKGNRLPRLAAQQISTDDGTWQLNPDGSMVTTWKLRPNIKWHDGTPFTSQDLLFSYSVYKDPDVPATTGAALTRMQAAAAPDPLTFVITWNAPFVDADRAPGLIPMPRHILEEAYRADKTSLLNHSWFTTEFVGLGAYRLAKWEPGSHMEFARFDDYYRGPAPLDRLTVRFIADANALIANILSGAVDVILSEGVDIDATMEVRRRWEGTRNQVIVLSERACCGLRHLELQLRPELARPNNGLPNLAVRTALFQGTDRKKLTEVITQGFGPIADSWVPPYHALRPQLESAVPPLPFDAGRAQQLLAQAGWARSPSGQLVHQTNGERFEIMLYSSQGANVERAVNVIADDWKALGAEVELYTIPIALAADREHRSKLPGAGFTGGVGFDAFSSDRLHSRFITSAANRWSASNRGAYSNARVDDILDRLVVTIAPSERINLHRDLLREQMGDIAIMPLYWDIRVVPAVQGVRNLDTGAWNLFEWTKEG